MKETIKGVLPPSEISYFWKNLDFETDIYSDRACDELQPVFPKHVYWSFFLRMCYEGIMAVSSTVLMRSFSIFFTDRAENFITYRTISRNR